MPILRNFLLFTLPLASRVAFHSINNSVKTKNFCGNFPEDSENVEFPKIGAFKTSGNSGRKVRYKENSRQEMSENLGQPRKVVLFSKYSEKCCSILHWKFLEIQQKGPKYCVLLFQQSAAPRKKEHCKRKVPCQIEGVFYFFFLLNQTSANLIETIFSCLSPLVSKRVINQTNGEFRRTERIRSLSAHKKPCKSSAC